VPVGTLVAAQNRPKDDVRKWGLKLMTNNLWDLYALHRHVNNARLM